MNIHQVLSKWNPEEAESWDSKLAWRTLWVTTYTLTLSFCVWFLVSALAPQLTRIGFSLSASQLYWLVAFSGLFGGLFRFIFTFLPALLGTRRLLFLGTGLLLLPVVGWIVAVQDPATPYWWLLVLSAAAGIGGGTFSGYMASTSFYFPRRLQGTALGLQAGIGNFGMGLIQMLVPWVIGFGLLGISFSAPQRTLGDQDLWLQNAGFVLVPWIILALILIFFLVRSVPIRAGFRQQLKVLSLKHTWVMTAVYLMSFGIYSGLSAQLALIAIDVYGGLGLGDALPSPATYAFIGPLLGAATRALGGPICDRFGGAIVTFISGLGMIVGLLICLFFLQPGGIGQFWGFLTGAMVVFFFSGPANAGTFKQMPSIFSRLHAGGAIGWTASVAAFGPFIFGLGIVIFGVPVFFTVLVIFSIWSVSMVWHYYVRSGAEVPS